jgi:hypothetical protein
MTPRSKVVGRSQYGATLVITAILLVVLLGAVALCVDIGRLYLTRQYLANTCDAAALAGGTELPRQDKATAKALECAGANQGTPLEKTSIYQVSFPADGMTAKGATKIRVDGEQVVPHTFARVLGFGSRPVGAYAVVLKTGSIGWVNDQVVPWGIPWYDKDGNPYQYDNGVEYLLKVGSQTELGDGTRPMVGGNFWALALGGTGASNYRENIAWGYQGQVAIGDVVDTEPGNMVGPTNQGTGGREDRADQPPWADDTWNDYDYGNPRTVIVPIISPLSNGRAEVTVIGFAAFFLSSCTGKEVRGYFIGYTIPNAGGTGPDYGVYTFRLIE